MMLVIVENDLLKGDMPTVTYLRLDGNVPSKERQNIVIRFNVHPTIGCLLLKAQVMSIQSA